MEIPRPSFHEKKVSDFLVKTGKELNLETYQDDEGKVKPFIGDDAAVLGIPGRGRQQHAAVTLLDDDAQFTTYAGIYVPNYYANKGTQELTLTVYSRCVLIPETIDDWATIKTK